MNKWKAIKIIKGQMDEITQCSIDSLWVEQTKAYLKEIFGEGHEYTINMGNYKAIELTQDEIENMSIEDIDLMYNDLNRKAIRFLKMVIETIKNIGVPTRKNFLYKIDNNWLIFWCGIFLTTVFTTGYLLGYYRIILH